MNSNKYDDIINLPHHVSKTHPSLSRASYAAQFSPFAALTGYEGIVAETARSTEEKYILSDEEKMRLSERLSVVLEHLDDSPEISVIFFVPDSRKSGGKYEAVTGIIKKYKEYEREIIMGDGTVIPVGEIIGIRGALLDAYFSPY